VLEKCALTCERRPSKQAILGTSLIVYQSQSIITVIHELTFLFAGITEAFKADSFDKKINLGELRRTITIDPISLSSQLSTMSE
jgi:hypothetical protein